MEEKKPENHIITEAKNTTMKGHRSNRPLLFRLVRFVENAAFFLVVLLIALYLLFQSSYVQNKLISTATQFLSTELNTKVSIEHIDISLFDKVHFENIYLEDLNGDTLLFAGRLSAGLQSSFVTVFWKKLEVEKVILQDAQFRISKKQGEQFNNLKFLLDYFGSSKPKSKSVPFSIKAQLVQLDRVLFTNHNAVSGRRVKAYLESAKLRVKNLDIPSKIADVQYVEIDGIHFENAEYEVPEDTQPVKVNTAAKDSNSIIGAASAFFQFNVLNLSVKNGVFLHDRFDRSPARNNMEGVMDFDHLVVRDININLEQVYGTEDLFFKGKVNNISARELCGFELSHAHANYAQVSDTATILYGMEIRTPQSQVGDTIHLSYDTYRDYHSFVDEVHIYSSIKPESKVSIADIMYFSKPLHANKFFNKNKDKIAEATGNVHGVISKKLLADNMELRVGKKGYLKGNVRLEGLTKERNKLEVNVRADKLVSDMQTIRDIIPGFSAPANFDKLGNITLDSCKYDIIFGNQHIAYTKFDSDLGRGSFDMQLMLPYGNERTTYGGKLTLDKFNLGSWINNSQFGNIAFEIKVDSSSGLTLPTLDANIKGNVRSLEFRNYVYKDIDLNGKFANKVFDGALKVNDKNVELDFIGLVNFEKEAPTFKFSSLIKRMDLLALKLAKQDLRLSGDIRKIDLVGNKLDDIVGQVNIRNFTILRNGTEKFVLDSVVIDRNISADSFQSLMICTNILDASVNGRFNLQTAASGMLQQFSKSYPVLSNQLGLVHPPTEVTSTDQYNFQVYLKNTDNFTGLIAPGLDTLKNVNIQGNFDGLGNRLRIEADIPQLIYAGIRFEKTSFLWNFDQNVAKYALFVNNTWLSEKLRLEPVSLSGQIENEIIGFNLSHQNRNSPLRNLQLNGRLNVLDSLWQVKFDPSDISLFNDKWYISNDNFIRFKQNFIETNEFDLRSEDGKVIIINSFDSVGLGLSLTNFTLNFLDNFIKTNNITYAGKIFDFDVKVQDIFAMKDIAVFINTDTVFLKGEPYGYITGNVDMASLKDPLHWKLNIVGDSARLRTEGAWIPPKGISQVVGELGQVLPGQFQTNLTSTDFPMSILQKFIPGISNTVGKINLSVRLGGPFSRPEMNGKLNIAQGAFQLDYLKSNFHIINQDILLTNQLIWADGDTLLDQTQKSRAVISGGLRHENFKNWKLDCSIASMDDNFMVLNTQKGDNPTYYGQGVGKADAKFSGTFQKPDLEVNLTTSKGTKLYMPLSGEVDAKEASFIKWNQKDTLNTQPRSTTFDISSIKGMSFNMNLSITPEAEIQLIFDEQAGDIMKGTGNGEMSINYNRSGEMKIYGYYEIKKGEYTFTLLGIVNKPFKVAEGGYVRWYGDPYKAQIDINATYDANTSVYNFVAEEINAQNDDLKRLAQKSTRVNLAMNLTGDLFKPNIKFDFSFPDLYGDLKSITDNKLRTLHNDPNETNRQVFGLIVVGGFLPASSGFIQNSDYISTAFNSLTQVLTTQLSSHLSTLAAEWFGGAVSSIDFNIGYNQYDISDVSTTNPTNLSGRELQLQLSSGFLNDRITVHFGSQFGLGSSSTSNLAGNNGFLGGDVTVEIQISENKAWRLKMYQRSETELSSRRTRGGIGISFYKEYDSFTDMWNGRHSLKPIL